MQSFIESFIPSVSASLPMSAGQEASIAAIRLEAYLAQARVRGIHALDALEGLLVGDPAAVVGADEDAVFEDAVFAESVEARRSYHQWRWQTHLFQELDAFAETHGGDRQMLLALLTRDPACELAFASECMQAGSGQDALAAGMADAYRRIVDDMAAMLAVCGVEVTREDDCLPVNHDSLALLDMGLEGWLGVALQLLDVERSFPGCDAASVLLRLTEVYWRATTGQGDGLPACAVVNRDGLRFADAGRCCEYRALCCRGNMLDAMLDAIDMAARCLALAEVFGASPETVIMDVTGAEISRVSTLYSVDGISRATISRTIHRLSHAMEPGGVIRGWLGTLRGEANLPANAGLARRAGVRRAADSLAWKGRVAMPICASLNERAMRVLQDNEDALAKSEACVRRVLDEHPDMREEMAGELGALLESMHGYGMLRACHPHEEWGRVAEMLNSRKFSGVDRVSEQRRAGLAMWLAKKFGNMRLLCFDDLPGVMARHLERHGLAGWWDVMRERMIRHKTLDPALAERVDVECLLSGAALAGLLDDGQQAMLAEAGMAPVFDEVRDSVLAAVRMDLGLRIRTMLVDESLFARCWEIEEREDNQENEKNGEADGRAGPEDGIVHALALAGSFPGMVWGEPGPLRASVKKRDASRYPAVVEGILSALVGGHAVHVLETTARGGDALKKTDETAGKDRQSVWIAAAMRSGAAGLYGDWLLGQMDQAVQAGETGHAEGFSVDGEAPREAREQDAEAADLLEGAGPDSGSLNMWMTRAAMDWMLLDTLGDWMMPGYRHRLRASGETVDFNA